MIKELEENFTQSIKKNKLIKYCPLPAMRVATIPSFLLNLIGNVDPINASENNGGLFDRDFS